MAVQDDNKRASKPTHTQTLLSISLGACSRRSLAILLVPLIRPVQHLLYLGVRILPRDRNRWLFGSWGGTRYADNAAALFKYCNAADKSNIRCIWITKDRDICAMLRTQGYEAHLAWSLIGFLNSLRAGIYVFDGLTKDINHWTSNGAKRVLLRHGVGIKKIERSIDQENHRLFKLFHGKWWEQLIWSFLIPWHRIRPDLVLASSDVHAKQAERFFDVPATNIAITGMPRTDALFDVDRATQLPEQVKDWIASRRSSRRTICLFLPTFRDDGSHSALFDWKHLDELLCDTQASLLIKAHPEDRSMRKAYCGKYDHILAAPTDIDPGALLQLADCFITDYSSVVYDFMLLRRPIIFYCSDLIGYQRSSRTLDIPYEDASPGTHVRTLEELIEAIKEAATFDAENDSLSKEYEHVLSQFHAFQDCNSSQRVHDEMYKRFVEQAHAIKGECRWSEIEP